MVCVDLVSPFTIRTPSKTYFMLALTMIDPATGWFEIIEVTNKSATSIKDLFITTDWHVTRDLNLLSLTMEENSNVSSNKCLRKTIMGLKSNQLQVTTYHPQANAFMERVHKVAAVNDMLR
jgi:hypothetical protein